MEVPRQVPRGPTGALNGEPEDAHHSRGEDPQQQNSQGGGGAVHKEPWLRIRNFAVSFCRCPQPSPLFLAIPRGERMERVGGRKWRQAGLGGGVSRVSKSVEHPA